MKLILIYSLCLIRVLAYRNLCTCTSCYPWNWLKLSILLLSRYGPITIDLMYRNNRSLLTHTYRLVFNGFYYPIVIDYGYSGTYMTDCPIFLYWKGMLPMICNE